MIWKKLHIGICRTVDDIKINSAPSIVHGAKATGWRANMRILVVDDNEFPYATSLKAKGFHIEYEKDIEPDKAEDYDLVLCDQYGVGKKLHSGAEGGSLARAIKKAFPLKYVVLYTSQAKMSGYDKGLDKLDDIVYSGMDDDDFEVKMDEWCLSCLDPKKQWVRLRSLLLDAGVSVFTVSELENDFVKQYKKTGMYKMPKSIYGCESNAVETIVNGLLSQFTKLAVSKAITAATSMITATS